MDTKAGTLPPLTGTEDGFETHHGVPVSYLGEDCDRILALGRDGKHRLRAVVLPAMKSLYDGTYANDGWHKTRSEAYDQLEEHWAVRKPCDGVFCGGDCSWHISWHDVTAETPGAFPITVLEL